MSKCKLTHIERNGASWRWVCQCGRLGTWENPEFLRHYRSMMWRAKDPDASARWCWSIHASVKASKQKPSPSTLRPTHTVTVTQRDDGRAQWSCSCGTPRHADWMRGSRAYAAASRHETCAIRRGERVFGRHSSEVAAPPPGVVAKVLAELEQLEREYAIVRVTEQGEERWLAVPGVDPGTAIEEHW